MRGGFILIFLSFILLFSAHSLTAQAQTDLQLKTMPDGSIVRFDAETQHWTSRTWPDGTYEISDPRMRTMPDGTVKLFNSKSNRWEIKGKTTPPTGRAMPNGTIEMENIQTGVKRRQMPDGSIEELKEKTLFGISYDRWELKQTAQQRRELVDQAMNDLKRQEEERVKALQEVDRKLQEADRTEQEFNRLQTLYLQGQQIEQQGDILQQQQDILQQQQQQALQRQQWEQQHTEPAPPAPTHTNCTPTYGGGMSCNTY